MSGIAPPRAPADAMPAFPHVLEKIDMRQDLKWCAAILTEQPCDGGNLFGVWALIATFVKGGDLRMERFEILEEPTGTFSIFDTFAELPATVEGGTCIGLYRHEVPLVLLAAMGTVQPGDCSLPPSLSGLNGWQTDEGDPSLSDNLLA